MLHQRTRNQTKDCCTSTTCEHSVCKCAALVGASLYPSTRRPSPPTHHASVHCTQTPAVKNRACNTKLDPKTPTRQCLPSHSSRHATWRHHCVYCVHVGTYKCAARLDGLQFFRSAMPCNTAHGGASNNSSHDMRGYSDEQKGLRRPACCLHSCLCIAWRTRHCSRRGARATGTLPPTAAVAHTQHEARARVRHCQRATGTLRQACALCALVRP